MTDIRTRLLQIATSYVGCNAGPESRDRYRALVAPGEAANVAAAMTTAINPASGMPGMSGCALVIRGFLRLAGMAHAKLAPPYRNAQAVADLFGADPHSIGRDFDAIVTPKNGRRPKAGDIVRVGGYTGEVEHVYIQASSWSGDAVRSIDGGQRVPNAKPSERWQTINEKVRTWSEVRGILFDHARNSSDPGSGARRRVNDWIDVDKLTVGASPLAVELPPPVPSQPGGAELPRRPTLRRGDRGEHVAELQRRLLVATVDGAFGPKTEAALKAYQAEHGLESDGVCGGATWAKLLA